MKVRSVTAMYFSGTGTTERMVKYVASGLSEKFGVPMREVNFSYPAVRKEVQEFDDDDIVVIGTPVYAGRVPNLLLPYLKGNIKGRPAAPEESDGPGAAGLGAVAVPIVMFGNRAFDNALLELRTICDDNGFRSIAAGAFVGEHSFSDVLGAGRPDAADFALADELIRRVLERCGPLGPQAPDAARDGGEDEGVGSIRPVEVPGDLSEGYYQPRDRKGNFIDIRKVKPKTSEACDDCGLCAEICPMGAIDPSDPRLVPGICIKCGACIKRCPKGAKYYDDPGYLYHKEELEAMYSDIRAASEIF